MTKCKLTTHLIIALAALALAACGPGAGGTDAGSNDLTATRWVLTTLDGQAALTGTRVTLVFQDDGNAGGYAGCNNYGGPATWAARGPEDGEVSLNELGMNAAACGDPPGVMQQESAYTQLLEQAETYHVENGTLSLYDEAGNRLMTFDAEFAADMDPSGLVGTNWELVSMDGTQPLPGSTLTFTLDSATDYHGHAGCRDFSGEYGAEGDTIHFWSMGMSGNEACLADDAIFRQEHDYIEYISSSTTYTLDGDTLNLITPRGEVIVFRATE